MSDEYMGQFDARQIGPWAVVLGVLGAGAWGAWQAYQARQAALAKAAAEAARAPYRPADTGAKAREISREERGLPT